MKKHALASFAFFSLVAVTSIAASEPFFRAFQLQGGSADPLRGAAAGLGDIDLDGYDDFAVGITAPNPGKVRVLSGKDQSTLLELTPNISADQFGLTVAKAGDFNLDGRQDILVGAPSTNGSIRGAVFVFSGFDGTPLLSKSSSAFNDQFGFAACSMGDLNGDSIPELAVGAPAGGTNGTGLVYLLSGSNGATMQQLKGNSTSFLGSGEAFGHALAAMSDLNGDGKNDLLIGAPNASKVVGFTSQSKIGAIYFFSPVDNSVLLKEFGDASGDGYGFSVDAKDDFYVAGGPFANRYGLANLGIMKAARYLGQIYSYQGLTTNHFFGASVAFVSNIVENPGSIHPHVAVAAPGSIPEAGMNSPMVCIVKGTEGVVVIPINESASFPTVNSKSFLVSNAGDLDADGFFEELLLANASANFANGIVSSFESSKALFSSVGAGCWSNPGVVHPIACYESNCVVPKLSIGGLPFSGGQIGMYLEHGVANYHEQIALVLFSLQSAQVPVPIFGGCEFGLGLPLLPVAIPLNNAFPVASLQLTIPQGIPTPLQLHAQSLIYVPALTWLGATIYPEGFGASNRVSILFPNGTPVTTL